MDGTERTEIEIDLATSAAIRQAIERGEYESVQEIVDQALHAWRMDRLSEEEIGELRRLVQEGLDSGPPMDGDVAFATIRKHLHQLHPKAEVE